jgi:phytoene synthase
MTEAHALAVRPLECESDASRWAHDRDDERTCAAVVRLHARTFHAASRLLPAPKRRAAYALYAFCRLADDIVDHPGGAPVEEVARRLDAYANGLDATLAGRPQGAVFRELGVAIRAFGVPEHALRELLGGVARDLEPTLHARWSDLADYCAAVASSVGEMCTYVFGVRGDDAMRARAVRYARTLGLAMQLTNILRDVGEDARRGRCYLPVEDLAAFGLTASDVLERADLASDERWRPFMAFQIGRARTLYEAARPGLGLLAPDAGRCATAAATGYAAILDAIEANDYDTIGARARIGRGARVALLWRAWLGPVPAASACAGPHVEWPAVRPA